VDTTFWSIRLVGAWVKAEDNLSGNPNVIAKLGSTLGVGLPTPPARRP
jgi:hypothetical protein